MRLGTIVMVCLFAAVAVSAQGRGSGKGAGSAASRGMAQPYSSNAPAGTPHASKNRELGTDRAVDAGTGKKTGLDKQKTPMRPSHRHKKVTAQK